MRSVILNEVGAVFKSNTPVATKRALRTTLGLFQAAVFMHAAPTAVDPLGLVALGDCSNAEPADDVMVDASDRRHVRPEDDRVITDGPRPLIRRTTRRGASYVSGQSGERTDRARARDA